MTWCWRPEGHLSSVGGRTSGSHHYASCYAAHHASLTHAPHSARIYAQHTCCLAGAERAFTEQAVARATFTIKPAAALALGVAATHLQLSRMLRRATSTLRSHPV